MAYVAVRGGREAIESSLLRREVLRVQSAVLLEVEAIQGGMKSLIDQVMSEASLYDRELAALAIKQGQGSPEEAVFLLRAYRSTVPRLYTTKELNTDSLFIQRRISAAFKDIPGGQLLGSSPDYSQRLLDFSLIEERVPDLKALLSLYQRESSGSAIPKDWIYPKVVDYLRKEGLLKDFPLDRTLPKDVTTASISFPTSRSERLQVLTRGQTGAVTSLGYASLRGFGGGALHPTVGELRVGLLPLYIDDPYEETSEDREYYIGDIEISEVETLIPVTKSLGQGQEELEFELGYGICYGQNETKVIAMSLLDHNLETKDIRYPTHQEEFVLLHIDSVEATGFISHLKLPHYVTFQSKLEALRRVRKSGGSQE
ncbi:carbon-phosphorus lyase complex subunit PhnI [Spirochaeta cellobiosiphila]|uniref:carbon-phosphorus lyase complex subunit PhnI n=1 Tax=Spirochaeta cellobiosiphila TaxID=504483 RepID=UPI000426884D|nr:carbon-phosphorus lyase complex subunit PhnI [Spirochaeta cellobiosiphila]